MSTDEYLEALRSEGCTYTTVFGETDNPEMPAVVHHDGDTCPVHEGEE